MRYLIPSVCAALLVQVIVQGEASGESFSLDGASDSVVGAVRYVRAREEETLVDIAREFDLGHDQIVKANPRANRWIPGEGTEVTVPHLYILPSAARRGIVLNIAELRLYYYPSVRKGEPREVITYPVSIGRMDWRTPLGETKVIKKDRDPAWRPPPSIREEHARDGDPLPEVIPGGAPDNPLGRYALRLGIPSYLIHGVDERKAFGIGMRVTHGCIRMYPEDITQLFDAVPVGTPVLIIDQPIKIGRLGERIFLSVYQPLDDGEDDDAPAPVGVTTGEVVEYVRRQLGDLDVQQLEEIERIAEQGDGIPREIGRSALGLRGDGGGHIVLRTGGDKGSQRALNEEYDAAMGRYLTTPSEHSRGRPTEIERRESPSSYRDDQGDDRIRRYLEERY